jgi:hypothetical protein
MEREPQRERGLFRRDRTHPDLEELRAPREVRVGHELVHPARERLDVRVVAVVHPARLADRLEEARHRRAVLAEPRARDRERGEVRVRPRDVDGMADRDRRRPGLLLDDLDLEAHGLHRRDPDGLGSRTLGELSELPGQAPHQRVGHVARDAHGQVLPRVLRREEALHVLERERVDAGHRAERRMRVRGSREDVPLETLLAELLVVALAEVLHESVPLAVPEPLEIVLAEAGVGEHRQHEVEEGLPVVLVDDGRERRHLLVDLGREAGRHGEESARDLVVPLLARAALGDHRGGERRQAFLAARIPRGAGLEEELHDDLRKGPLRTTRPSRGRLSRGANVASFGSAATPSREASGRARRRRARRPRRSGAPRPAGLLA